MSGSRRLGWIFIVVGGVAVALATLDAASNASTANGDWQQSVRAQTRWTADTIANTRKVYVDEAPLALAINTALIRSEELTKRAGTDKAMRAQAEAEKAAAARYIREFHAAHGPINDLVATDRYNGGSSTGAPQLGRRLADLQAGQAANAKATADLIASGDQAARHTYQAMWGAVAGLIVAAAGYALWQRGRPETARETRPLAAAADESAAPPTGARMTRSVRPKPYADGRGRLLVGLTATAVWWTFRRRAIAHLSAATIIGVLSWDFMSARNWARPVPAADPPEADGVPPAPEPGEEEPPELVIAPPELPAAPEREGAPPRSPLPAILLATVAAVVTMWQIQAGTEESRLLADAARRADVVTGAADGGLIRQTFATNGQQTALLVGQKADEFRRAGGDPRIAAADNAVYVRTYRLASDIGIAPSAADGVDEFTQTIVAGLEGQTTAMQKAQASTADAAQDAGQRSDWLVVTLFALTVASSLTEIGRAMSDPGKALLVRRLGYGLAGVVAVSACLINALI